MLTFDELKREEINYEPGKCYQGNYGYADHGRSCLLPTTCISRLGDYDLGGLVGYMIHGKVFWRQESEASSIIMTQSEKDTDG